MALLRFLQARMKPRQRKELRWINGFFLLLVWGRAVCYGQVIDDSIQPNFVGSYMTTVDVGGVILQSNNSFFELLLDNPAMDTNYYLCIEFVQSRDVVWWANTSSPMAPDSGEFLLNKSGAVIQNSVGEILWSALAEAGKDVVKMQLTDNGNLVMLDASNNFLWQSFDHPTDTLLLGQRLVRGSSLVSRTAENNYSPGDYRVLLTDQDLVLVWISQRPLDSQTYWSMVGDTNYVIQAGYNLTGVNYAAVNESGFNLYAEDSSIIWQIVNRCDAALKRAVIQPNGQFSIQSYTSSGGWLNDFQAVENDCLLPKTCGPLGVCKGVTPMCSCPAALHFVNQADESEGCTGREIPSCDANYTDMLMKKSVEFVGLGQGVGYFADKFQNPIQTNISVSNCQQLCSINCSCAGFTFKNDSGSCFVHETLGTLKRNNGSRDSTFLKVIAETKIPPKKKPILPIALGSVGAVSITVLSICFGWLWCRKRGQQYLPPFPISSDAEDEHVLRFFRTLPTRFSYKELQVATDDFSHEIGSGGYAVVYEGTLPNDNTKVAVKKLYNATDGKGREEFYSEIAMIGSIHHVNLVKLRGFCVEGSNRLLVYEFMNRGSLDRSLFGPTVHPVLEWNERYDIALGTARGLSYLHEECSEKIIHCDVKPENILLNDKSQTKVSDFGLAKLMSREQSQTMVSNMRGTRGYMAPEWLTNAPISHKTDVYSYGMVLLEIVSGRKNFAPPDLSIDMDCSIDLSFNLDYFPAYAMQLCQQGGPYTVLADPRLEGRFPAEEVVRLVKIALCCLHEDPNMRPSMSKVVHMLEGNVRVEDPQVESLLFLRFFARGISSHIPASAASFLDTKKHSASTTRSSSFSSPPQMSMISAVQLSHPR